MKPFSFLILIGSLFLNLGCQNQWSTKDETKTDLERRLDVMQNELNRYKTLSSASPLSQLGGNDIDVESYSLKAQFDWPTKTLLGKLNLLFTIKNVRGNSIVLLSQVQVSGVTASNGKALPFTQDIATKSLSIDISSLVSATDEIDTVYSVFIQYSSKANRNAATVVGGALSAIEPRDLSKGLKNYLHTQSEPYGCSLWMPCKPDFTDRARFAIEMTLPENEMLIANGRIVKDVTKDGFRTMAYQTDFPLPAYLMAFTTGEFQMAQAMHNHTPVKVFARKGFNVDTKNLLDIHLYYMDIFERLLGPYPFPEYALVLLPDFPGGMENAGITFCGEGTLSSMTFSHELSHHWWGDNVTMATVDEVWIKEGMGSLLTFEGERNFRDRNNEGNSNVSLYPMMAGYSVLNPNGTIADKYNLFSAYGRAAFVHDQIKFLVGEARFWEIQRQIMHERHMSYLTTKEYLNYFRKDLGESNYQKVQASLYSKELPQLKVEETAADYVLKLIEKEITQIVPLEFVVYLDNGQVQNLKLPANGSIAIPKTGVAYVQFDPLGKSLDLDMFLTQDSQTLWGELVKKFSTDKDMPTVLEKINGLRQKTFFTYKKEFKPISVADFLAIYSRLKSMDAEIALLRYQCKSLTAQNDPKLSPTWTPLIENAVYSLNLYSSFQGTGAINSCRPWLSDAFFNTYLEKVDAKYWDKIDYTALFKVDLIGPKDLSELQKMTSGFKDGSTDTHLSVMVAAARSQYTSKRYSDDEKNQIAAQLVDLGLRSKSFDILKQIFRFLTTTEIPARWSVFKKVSLDKDIITMSRISAFCNMKAAEKAAPDVWADYTSVTRSSKDELLLSLLVDSSVCH